MREIKFRGRSLLSDKYAGIKKGDFVFGSFIKTDIDAPAIVWGDGEQMEVDTETVGQFTGLTDKNGIEIYERDIVKHIKDYIWTVIFDNNEARFALVCKEPLIRPLFKDRAFNLEVIGNIYENPDLIGDL